MIRINIKKLVFISSCWCFLWSFQIVADTENIGSSTHELRGGNVITGFSGVVEISTPGGGDYCTGSMVAPSIILTAAHCLTNVSTMTSNGTGNFVITYHDPTTGRREVYNGNGNWFVHQDYNPADTSFGAGYANSDIGVIKMPKNFIDTDYHDFLRIYDDNRSHLNTRLNFYGGGYYSYSGNIDDKLRTSYFNVEHVKKNHIVIDNRKKTTVCKGDSGGPLIYSINQTSTSIPTVTGVASNMELGDGFEGGLCANNDWGIDDAFFSRTNWGKLSSVMNTANVFCGLYTVENISYRRCFDLPFINDVIYEGLEKNLAVAIVITFL